MLVAKTIEHRMQGAVCAIHAISVAAKPLSEQERILTRMKDADVGVIVCPSAAISMKQLDAGAPLHNSIAPVPRLIEKGIRTYLGVDNISDLFMPLVDGDIWFECRLLMEASRFYDIDAVAKIACDKTGFGSVVGQRSKMKATNTKARIA
jgi:cytosine/adenosine deaminase-related metal-dependent hydrolase